MDSRESNQLHQSSQSQMQSHPQMMLGTPNSYTHGLINGGASSGMMPPISAAAMMQNHPFSLNSAGQSASMDVGNLNPQFAGGSMPPNGPSPFNIDQGRKKRGRPRKYSPENNINLGLASDSGPSLTPASAFTSTTMVAIHDDDANVRTPASEASGKKHRGRPPSSGKKQLDALGSFGIGFTPHVIFVEAGEDIAAKIMAFSREGPRTVCIMSAHGAISKATLLQASTSSGIVSYEGRFEIISLTGAFMPSEGNIADNRISPLSVSLAGSDGRVLGGGVGKLIAANTIQVIVGSFIADGKKPKPGVSPTPSNVQEFGARATVAAAAEGHTPSEGHSSDSSHDEDDSPYDNSSVPPSGPPQGPPQFNNSARPVQNMAPYSHLDWGSTTMKMFHN